MNTELTVAQSLGLEVSKPESPAPAGFVTGGKQVPWVKLIGKTSNEAGKDPSLIGNFILVDGSSQNKVENPALVFVAGYCYKAVRYEPQLEIAYDPESSLFQSIEAQANKGGDSGAQYGAEIFLVTDSGLVCTLFLASKSARNKIPEFDALVGKFGKLTAEFIDPPKSKYSWWCPAINSTQDSFELGNSETVATTLNFLKSRQELKRIEAEKVDESSDDSGR